MRADDAPGTGSGSDTPGPHLDLDAYRMLVSELTGQVEAVVTSAVGRDARDRVEALLEARSDDPVLEAVLAATPDGRDAALKKLLAEVHDYRPNDRSSASDVPTLVRIYLLSLIDAIWWADSTTFRTDQDVVASSELVELNALRRRGVLDFTYRLQPKGLAGRSRDWALRRAMPGRRPHTAGVRFTRARPELVALLNQIAGEFAGRAPSGTPRLWVTSLTRSLQHQQRLRDLGYAAMIPSAHCFGYAADVEMRWFRQFGADDTLATVLLEHQAAGQCNVIDEGQAWHVCIDPGAVDALQRAYRRLGGA